MFPQPKTQSEIVQKFRTYLDDDWKQWMTEYPEMATEVGFPGQNRRWTDNSPAGIELRKQHLHASLAALKKIPRELLPDEEKLHYDVYQELLEVSVEGLQYGDEPKPFRNVMPVNLWMPIDQMNGIQEASFTISSMPYQKVSDYQDILARLEALPQAVAQCMTLMQEGLQRGYSPPKLMLRNLPKQLADLIPQDPLASALLEPFTKFPVGISKADQTKLTDLAKNIYTNAVRPAFTKLHDYVADTYVPSCRETIAATDLPNGEAAYKFHMRWHTTTDLNAKQVHDIGLTEVKRIRMEMEKVIAEAEFKGSFDEFLEFVKTDPKFYYTSEDDLLNGYRVIAKKIDPELMNLFGKLPSLTYGVYKIPDFHAPSAPAAYYNIGSVDAGRPGKFYANTYKLSARPKWEMEALTLHESVPGHHLQLSLAQEKANNPEFRKHVGYTAYVEGWGLYAEGLGSEIGLYKDPYSKFGQLCYEMWRAVRLVVDTGMHTMGWSRDDALKFFKENTGKSTQDSTSEVDRYIVMPAQALGYKLGQLKILELRKEAERTLGDNFDVRKFHDAVIDCGAVPQSVLENHMHRWMQQEQAAQPVKRMSLA